jgi:hypothetical protein
VEKLLVFPCPLKDMNEITLEGNLMHVNNVGKPSILPVTFKDMNEFIGVRNPICVSSVEKP